MKSIAMLLVSVLIAGAASASDVYVTTDAQGHKIYTDTPQTVPAQKLDVHSESTDATNVAQRYSSEMSKYAKDDKANSKAQAAQASAHQAAQLSAEDKAKQCADARQRYQTYMNSWRLYELGPNGERTYLT